MDGLLFSSELSHRTWQPSQGALFVHEDGRLPIFVGAYFSLYREHIILYKVWIDQQHTFPEDIEPLLTFLVFQLTYFLLNFVRFVRIVHIYSISFRFPRPLCQKELKEASICRPWRAITLS